MLQYILVMIIPTENYTFKTAFNVTLNVFQTSFIVKKQDS